MRYVLPALLSVLVLAAYGCGPAKPMTESEFKGFCYQFNGSLRGGCGDIIAICDSFSPVMSLKQDSLEACSKACADTARPLAMRYAVSECSGGVEYASDWCQRYCKSTYPK